MTEFVGRIKKCSQYYGQTQPGEWFSIDFRYRYDRFFINSSVNTYQLEDVDIGAKQPNGHIVILNRAGGRS